MAGPAQRPDTTTIPGVKPTGAIIEPTEPRIAKPIMGEEEGLRAAEAKIKAEIAKVTADLVQAKLEQAAATKTLKVGPVQDAALRRVLNLERRLTELNATATKLAAEYADYLAKQQKPQPERRGSMEPSIIYGPPSPSAVPPAIAKAQKKTTTSQVIAELKKEEAKGGPDIFDILEAAGAGWGGRKSQYAERQQREKEAETEMQRLIKATELQAAAGTRAGQEEYERQARLQKQRFELEKLANQPQAPAGFGPLASGLLSSGAITPFGGK